MWSFYKLTGNNRPANYVQVYESTQYEARLNELGWGTEGEAVSKEEISEYYETGALPLFQLADLDEEGNIQFEILDIAFSETCFFDDVEEAA